MIASVRKALPCGLKRRSVYRSSRFEVISTLTPASARAVTIQQVPKPPLTTGRNWPKGRTARITAPWALGLMIVPTCRVSGTGLRLAAEK